MGRLILTGFMCSGKTTCGRLLSREFLLSFTDTDKRIEEQEKKSISAIFSENGEEYFRDLETAFLKKLAGSGFNKDGVIALGGGMIVREENRKLLKNCGTVVYLKASPECLKERLQTRAEKRPLMKGENISEKVDKLMEERGELYLMAADEVIEVDDLELFEIVNKLKAIYNRRCR